MLEAKASLIYLVISNNKKAIPKKMLSRKKIKQIRFLTPRESFVLMGFDNNDFDKIKNKNISDAQIYKQAGNSIVVNVLEKIFEQIKFIEENQNDQ